MPAMASITVKKDDTSTDVIYVAIQASSGDKSPAIWRQDGFGGTPGQRPELRISAASNGNNTGRKLTGSYTYPHTYVEAVSGLTKVNSRANAQFTVALPNEFPDANAAEFGAQFGNLMAAALIEEILTSGYSAV
jgi:hypothetical protein